MFLLIIGAGAISKKLRVSRISLVAGCEDKPTTVHEVKLFFIIRPYQY